MFLLETSAVSQTESKQSACCTHIGSGRTKTHDGGSGDGFAPSNGIDTLIGFGLDAHRIDRQRHQPREFLADGLLVRAQFRALGVNGDIHIYGCISLSAHPLQGFGEKPAAINSAVLGVGIRKHIAYIGQTGGSGQGVNDGMDDDISVAVADRPAVVIDSNVAEDERPAGFESVQVGADAHAVDGDSVSHLVSVVH